MLKQLQIFFTCLLFLSIIVSYYYLASFETWAIFQRLPSIPFDALALSLQNGNVTIPAESLWYEKLITERGVVMYFGVWPALLRIPILFLFPELYGKVAGISCLLAAFITCASSFAFLNHGKNTSVFLTVLIVLAISFASPLIYLVSVPTIYQEAILWALAFSITALYLKTRRYLAHEHSTLESLVYGLMLISRITFALPWLLYSSYLMVLNLKKSPTLQTLKQSLSIRLPLLIAVIFQCWYNYARFDSPLKFTDFSVYELESSEHKTLRAQYHTFNLARVPYSIYRYLLIEPHQLSQKPRIGIIERCDLHSRPALFWGDHDEPCISLSEVAPWIPASLIIVLVMFLYTSNKILTLGFIIQIVVVCSYYFMSFRYTTEMLPLALLGIQQLFHASSPKLKYLCATVLGACIVLSLYLTPKSRGSWLTTQSMLPHELYKKYSAE